MPENPFVVDSLLDLSKINLEFPLSSIAAKILAPINNWCELAEKNTQAYEFLSLIQSANIEGLNLQGIEELNPQMAMVHIREELAKPSLAATRAVAFSSFPNLRTIKNIYFENPISKIILQELEDLVLFIHKGGFSVSDSGDLDQLERCAGNFLQALNDPSINEALADFTESCKDSLAARELIQKVVATLYDINQQKTQIPLRISEYEQRALTAMRVILSDELIQDLNPVASVIESILLQQQRLSHEGKHMATFEEDIALGINQLRRDLCPDRKLLGPLKEANAQLAKLDKKIVILEAQAMELKLARAQKAAEIQLIRRAKSSIPLEQVENALKTLSAINFIVTPDKTLGYVASLLTLQYLLLQDENTIQDASGYVKQVDDIAEAVFKNVEELKDRIESADAAKRSLENLRGKVLFQVESLADLIKYFRALPLSMNRSEITQVTDQSVFLQWLEKAQNLLQQPLSTNSTSHLYAEFISEGEKLIKLVAAKKEQLCEIVRVQLKSCERKFQALEQERASSLQKITSLYPNGSLKVTEQSLDNNYKELVIARVCQVKEFEKTLGSKQSQYFDFMQKVKEYFMSRIDLSAWEQEDIDALPEKIKEFACKSGVNIQDLIVFRVQNVFMQIENMVKEFAKAKAEYLYLMTAPTYLTMQTRRIDSKAQSTAAHDEELDIKSQDREAVSAAWQWKAQQMSLQGKFAKIILTLDNPDWRSIGLRGDKVSRFDEWVDNITKVLGCDCSQAFGPGWIEDKKREYQKEYAVIVTKRVEKEGCEAFLAKAKTDLEALRVDIRKFGEFLQYMDKGFARQSIVPQQMSELVSQLFTSEIHPLNDPIKFDETLLSLQKFNERLVSLLMELDLAYQEAKQIGITDKIVQTRIVIESIIPGQKQLVQELSSIMNAPEVMGKARLVLNQAFVIEFTARKALQLSVERDQSEQVIRLKKELQAHLEKLDETMRPVRSTKHAASIARERGFKARGNEDDSVPREKSSDKCSIV